MKNNINKQNLVTLQSYEYVCINVGGSTILDGVRRTIKNNGASCVLENKVLVLAESLIWVG